MKDNLETMLSKRVIALLLHSLVPYIVKHEQEHEHESSAHRSDERETNKLVETRE